MTERTGSHSFNTNHGQIQFRLAQKDTEASLELAVTSTKIATAAKRDSSSMKVIALLTTLFLPGAFVGVGSCTT